VGAIERVVASGKSRTTDLGGTARTQEFAEAIGQEI
jgi:isocitrate/isopropylmalate dehydrogenase